MDVFQAQLEAQKSGICCAMLTVVEVEGTSAFQVGKKMLLCEDGRSFGTIGGGTTEADALNDAAEAIKGRKSYLKKYIHSCGDEAPGLGCHFQISLFIEIINPKLQFVVCGGGHVGGAALKLAKHLNFETILIDSRPADQLENATPHADRLIINESFEDAVKNAGFSEEAYYLCSASSHTLDKSALKGILAKPFSYVGMLGNSKKKIEMFRQLESDGFSKELLEQVHTPVGLDICDMSPEEVAFSILSEVLMIKNGGTGRSRKDI